MRITHRVLLYRMTVIEIKLKVKMKIHSIWKRKPNLTIDILTIKQTRVFRVLKVYHTRHNTVIQVLQYRSTMIFHIFCPSRDGLGFFN